MAALIYWIDHRQQKSGELIKLGPDPEPPGGMGSSLGPTDDGRHCTPSEWELGKDISHSALNEDERFVSGQPGGAKAQTNNLMEAVRV